MSMSKEASLAVTLWPGVCVCVYVCFVYPLKTGIVYTQSQTVAKSK